MRVGALDDGMLPVNTAGSPGGGLQWPSGGGFVEWRLVAEGVDDGGVLVEWQLVDWLQKVLMMMMMGFAQQSAAAAWASLRLRY